MPKGSSKNREQEHKRARSGKRGTSRPKGEATTRTRGAQRTDHRKLKGEERQKALEQLQERAEAIAARSSERAMRMMQHQADTAMKGETTMLEQQSRKTMIEAIDHAQKLANQAQQMGAHSIRTSANLAQDWLTLTWQMWDTAAETMRNLMRGRSESSGRGEE